MERFGIDTRTLTYVSCDNCVCEWDIELCNYVEGHNIMFFYLCKCCKTNINQTEKMWYSTITKSNTIPQSIPSIKIRKGWLQIVKEKIKQRLPKESEERFEIVNGKLIDKQKGQYREDEYSFIDDD